MAGACRLNSPTSPTPRSDSPEQLQVLKTQTWMASAEASTRQGPEAASSDKQDEPLYV